MSGQIIIVMSVSAVCVITVIVLSILPSVKSNLTAKWRNKVRDYCDSQYSIIKVVPGNRGQDRRCHLDATHYAVKSSHSELALVAHRHKNSLLPCVHFVNQ